MNVISLFAGCGGLDLGFEKAGFNVVWANEFDETIHPTYKLNHPNTILCGKDIRNLKNSDIPDCEGIIGGPPCQSWSVGGKGLGIKDDRGKLFFDYIRIVKAKKPKFFIIENVAGILEEKHKTAFDYFLSLLIESGYKVVHTLLNSVDYEVPQDRFRVFIVGLRSELNLTFTFPEKISNTPINLKTAIGDIKDDPQYSSGMINEKITSSGLWNHDCYDGPYSLNYMHSNRVRSWDEVSYTIQAQASNAPQHPQAPKMEYSPNGGRMFKRGSEHLYRRLSVRECARIQSFPDSFRFVYDNIKDGYKMVGNAVPPMMAYFLALQLKGLFDSSMPPNMSHSREKVEVLFKKVSGHDLKFMPFKVLSHTSQIHQRDLLVGLVKHNSYLDFDGKKEHFYYSGIYFPSAIDIRNINFFVPYISGKGIRDLYRIVSVRIASKKEIFKKSDDDSSRLLFEIEFIKEIFPEYVPFHLNIWHTFSFVSLSSILNLSSEIRKNS